MQRLDPLTFSKVGDPIAISTNFGVAWSESDTISFSSGNQVEILTQSGTSHQKLTVKLPKLRDLLPGETVVNYNIESGKQVTDPTIKESVIASQPTVDSELQISLNPNSAMALIGLDPVMNPLSKISLPVQGQSSISIYSTDSSHYTVDQLLKGQYQFSGLQLISSSQLGDRRNLAERQLDVLGNASSLDSANATDDASYYYGEVNDDLFLGSNTTSATISDSYTILVLPNNQTIILVGVNATELARSPHNYYSFSELEVESASPSSQTTTSPVPNPTLKPTHQPISFMTNFLLPVPKGSAISSEFGDTQGDSFNNGITFKVAEGTSINAIASGTVIRTITNHPEFGNVVVVRHDDGQTGSLYAYLNRIDVAVGDLVTDTTPVGLSGFTNAGNARLHLEVIDGSAFLDVIEAASGTDIGSDYELSLINPRPLFNTRYTDAEFSRTVVADAAEITADSRDNKAKSTNSASDTILYSNAGNDKYFFDFTKDGIALHNRGLQESIIY